MTPPRPAPGARRLPAPPGPAGPPVPPEPCPRAGRASRLRSRTRPRPRWRIQRRIRRAARAGRGRATEAILADTLEGRHRGVVVDSPPGAGKSTLVVRAARELAAAGHPLMVVAQTNAQVDDLVDRLATADPELPVGRLHSSEPRPYDPALDRHPAVRTSAKPADLAGLDIVVIPRPRSGRGSKTWSPGGTPSSTRRTRCARTRCWRSRGSSSGRCSWATRVSWTPFSQVGADQWAGHSHDPSASAVSTLLGHNPDLPQHRLPVSWRLPASAAPLVSGAFYPYTPFRSGTGPGDRRLAFAVPPDGSRPDGCWTRRREEGWGLLELPAARTPAYGPGGGGRRRPAGAPDAGARRGGAQRAARRRDPGKLARGAADGVADRGGHRASRPGCRGARRAGRTGGRGQAVRGRGQ